jgi:hypothetical protein
MEAHALQVGTLQVGAGQVTPLQADAGEVCTGKISASQNRAGEADATKIGAGQIGAGKIAAIKAGTAKHATTTIVAGLGEECGDVLRGSMVHRGNGHGPRQSDAQDGLKRAHNLPPDRPSDRGKPITVARPGSTSVAAA